MIQLNARNYAWNKRKHDTAQHSCVRHLGNALDKRDWRWHLTSAFSQRLRKYTFTAVHTKTHKRRFQIYPLWRAFSNLCVYGERFHRLRVDGRPKRIKKFAFTSVCVYNRLRVDGALVGWGLLGKKRKTDTKKKKQRWNRWTLLWLVTSSFHRLH